MSEEVMIRDRATGGYETPLSEVLATFDEGAGPADCGLDPASEDIGWDFIVDWDDEDDPGHWVWTLLHGSPL